MPTLTKGRRPPQIRNRQSEILPLPSPPRPGLTPLLELTFSDRHTVDRDAGVIRGVKVLGRESRNGREYSDRALHEAARLYDGIGVNLNHPDRCEPNPVRPVEAGFGWLEAVEV